MSEPFLKHLNYGKLLGEIFHHHRVYFHQHADYTQLHILAHGELSNGLISLSQCLETIKGYMASNGEKLNLGKTESL